MCNTKKTSSCGNFGYLYTKHVIVSNNLGLQQVSGKCWCHSHYTPRDHIWVICEAKPYKNTKWCRQLIFGFIKTEAKRLMWSNINVCKGNSKLAFFGKTWTKRFCPCNNKQGLCWDITAEMNLQKTLMSCYFSYYFLSGAIFHMMAEIPHKVCGWWWGMWLASSYFHPQ